MTIAPFFAAFIALFAKVLASSPGDRTSDIVTAAAAHTALRLLENHRRILEQAFQRARISPSCRGS